MAKFVLPYVDASNEKSSFSLYVDDAITDANITVLYAAAIGLSLDGDQQSRLVTTAAKDGTNDGKASNLEAQREKKWLYVALSTNGDIVTFEQPCANWTALSSDGKTVDLTAGAGLAAKTAWDANVTDRFGNATTLQEIRAVGRNN